MTRCTALELAPKQVRVNAVNPGVIKTELHLRSGKDQESYVKVSGKIFLPMSVSYIFNGAFFPSQEYIVI